MRTGIYTKDESRIERQREEDDYKFWHGDPGPVDTQWAVDQAAADRREERFNRMREDMGYTADVLHEEYRQGFLKTNGTHIDVALREFSQAVLAGYPFVHCYRFELDAPKGVKECFHVMRQVCPADPHFTWNDVLIARKTPRSLSLDEVVNGEFPAGTFITKIVNGFESWFPVYKGYARENKIKVSED